MTSLRCTSVIGGKCTWQITLLNSICTKLCPTKRLSANKDFWINSNLKVFSVKFIVILKYPRISEKLFPIFHPSSRTLMLLEMKMVRLWKKNTEKEGLLTQSGRMPISSFFLGDWNNHYNFAALLHELGDGLQKIISLCAIDCDEVLQQLCSTCSECWKRGRREFKF